MDPLGVLPTPLDVEVDLKQIVHNLERWEALSLFALRALPSVRSWAPHPEKRRDFVGKPALAVSNAAIRQRIEEAITRIILEEDWQALGSIFTFDKLTLNLTERREDAAGDRKETSDSFRKKNEEILLRVLAGEMYRWELEQALRQIQLLSRTGELDTTSPTAAQ